MTHNKKKFRENFIDLKDSFLRFSIPWLCAVTASFLACYTQFVKDTPTTHFNALFSLLIGIPFSLGVTLLFESKKIKNSHFIAAILSVLVITSHFLITKSETNSNYFVSNLSVLLIFSSFFSFAPFLERAGWHGFWNFNYILFQRFVLSFVYSGFLSLGFIFALLILKFIINISIDESYFMSSLLFSFIGFNILFFVIGLPRNFQELNKTPEYPNWLNILIQNLIIPFTLLYNAIMYVYLAKILFSWSLPEGKIGWLVSSLSVLGIICHFFLKPLKFEEKKKWCIFFERYFYILLLPLLYMLFVGLYSRINEYGITENRYYLFASGIWLVFICLYFIISKSKNIKIIPISLSIISLLTSFGPWSASHVALTSQISSFKSILEKNKILVDGKISSASHEISFDEEKRISGIIDYIIDFHDFKSFSLLLPLNDFNEILRNKDLTDKSQISHIRDSLLNKMNLKYISKWKEKNGNEIELRSTSFPRFQSINEFQNFLGFNLNESNSSLSNDHIKINLNNQNSSLTLYKYDKELIDIPLSTFIRDTKKLSEEHNYMEEDFYVILNAKNKNAKVKIYFESIDYIENRNSIDINSLKGFMFIQEK
ncbi:DUF4153 domain-containing protein [Silvanigrella aquatica]|uniref:DUF4153 domain-containing protein n=1 Tax=Silvanigrella aquatica TaxID=1915309 RepID=A0A1L4CXI3_9BACT|nr:DUF4153 domain-containing protein [Silvanigrella aquatica]APJ02661.1 hypothetical protein AXG55_01420 [Silvanigrella aquatica]